MTAQLDIDDVVADHPLAKAELERLRAAIRQVKNCRLFGDCLVCKQVLEAVS